MTCFYMKKYLLFNKILKQEVGATPADCAFIDKNSDAQKMHNQ